jgi:hypothetical protein
MPPAQVFVAAAPAVTLLFATLGGGESAKTPSCTPKSGKNQGASARGEQR